LSNYYQPRGIGRGFFSFPPVIKNLIIINGIVFFIQILLEKLTLGGIPFWYILNKWFALNPISGYDLNNQPFNFQIWQLVTYQFMHSTSGFSHILFNMFGLWMFGSSIEDIMGSKKFLIFYLLAGVSAGLLHLFLSPILGGLQAITIGASGAVYGVLIAYALFFPDNLIYLYFFIPVKAKYFIGFLVVIEFLAVNSANDNVAHLAHLGGALFGFLFIYFDKNSNVGIKNLFNKNYYFKQNNSKSIFSNPFSKPKSTKKNAEYADFYDLNSKDEIQVTQKEIDEILDKISQSGYQNLTEQEKKILFEASKKMK
jgi:membrane associated rhomboid family serine protease